MKIICEGIELSDAVMKVVKACSVKTTNPVLECIKITAANDSLELLATDGEIAIDRKIKAEVLEVMGEPLSDESFCRPDLWFYYHKTVWADGLVTEDECMPLVFQDGKLIGWGNEYYTRCRLKAFEGDQE